MHSGHTASGGGLIDHIVVNQRGRVDHLGDLGQATVPRGEIARWGQGPGHQQNNARADVLSSGAEQMLCSGLKNRMAGTNETAQITEQNFEIMLDRLQQLSDCGHGSPRCADPRRRSPLTAG